MKEPLFEETGLFFKVTIFSIEDNKNVKAPIDADGVTIDADRVPINADRTPIDYNNLSADEIKIIEYLKLNEFITNSVARQLLDKKDTAVKKLFKKLTTKNIIKAVGERRYRKYTLH